MSYTYFDKPQCYQGLIYDRTVFINNQFRVSGTESDFTVDLDGYYEGVFKIDLISYVIARPAVNLPFIGIILPDFRSGRTQNGVSLLVNNYFNIQNIGGTDFLVWNPEVNNTLVLYEGNYENFNTLKVRFVNPHTRAPIVIPGLVGLVLRFRLMNREEKNVSG